MQEHQSVIENVWSKIVPIPISKIGKIDPLSNLWMVGEEDLVGFP